jgi:hypothetical protein
MENLQRESEDEALMIAMAMSKSELPFGTPIPSSQFKFTKPNVEDIFPSNSDEIIESTPRFAESTLSKKYQTSRLGSITQKQVTNIWRDLSQPTNVSHSFSLETYF